MTTNLALGLMSGTSADGISAALASFTGHTYHLIGYLTQDYPASIIERIKKGGDMSAAELSSLNVELGELFAQAALKLLKKTHTDPKDVACIGSHGQTVYHGPRDAVRNTLQIADPAVIAERTGISTVSNFRQRDIAAGGEGAPLIPFFDQYFFGTGPVRALQNIGGISNVAIVGKGIETPLAFDQGPGNCLMDAAVRLITKGAEHYDRNGQRAKRGQMNMEAVARLMETDYFQLPPPKSTGPELFNEKFLKERMGSLLQSHPDDALATLNYFTCLTIQESFRNYIFKKYPVEEIIVSGGGVHNRMLMKKLECLFAPIPVKSIETMGMASQAKEPLAFAFFGLRCLQNKINHLPSGTGAKFERVLGNLTRY